ncbi:hypothetical protein BDR07DRAFT_1406383 [Suillus spraguei]|nr:hypothetical protein BDR07DRAFT_1433528 [Suillus spraguei]KAG2357424.1 hypothetical protein BDR07DRAFT_1420566 [Suillus spraguei]KAG2362759.1 hypothetical protein BDR07DRAFT_1406383 [Suillus spraguei]
MRFAEQHRDLDCLEELPDRDHIDYEDIAMARARELLGSWSGIYFLDYRKCHNPPDGIIPLEWITAFNGVYNEEPDDTLDAIELVTVQVFYVCSDRGNFNRRPTQQQLKSLTKLIGHPPQWWVAVGYGPSRYQ